MVRAHLLPWLLCSALVSCGATLWSRPAEEIKAALAKGNTAFLLSLQPRDLEADVGALGPGAAWALGQVFAEAGRRDEAVALWKRALAGGGSWALQAGRDLFAVYADQRDWVQAELIAQGLFGRERTPEFQRKLFEAYYFQRKDEKAWTLLQSWKPGTFSPAQERENLLFLGVLAARLGKPAAAAKALTEVVWNQESSELHDRLESFINEDPSRASLLGPGGRDALAFQALVFRGSSRELEAWLQGRELPEGFWNHRALIFGLQTAFKAEARADRGLRLLETAAAGLTGGAQFEAAFTKGRFYRSLARWAPARGAFQAAMPLASSPEEYRRAAWNWLNAWVQLDAVGALGPFVQVYSATAEPEYFSDVLADWMSEVVQSRRWDLLAAAWRDFGRKMTETDTATLGFVLARLAAYGLVDLPRQGISQTPRELLEQALAADPFSYEALVARAVLGRGLEWPEQPPVPFEPAEDWDSVKTFWQGLADFGLTRRLTAEAAAYTGPLDAAFVDSLVGQLQANGLYRPSLQLVYRLLKEPGQVLTRERALRLFPTPFEDLVTARAQAEGLEISLLYGLIRAESAFDAGARSWVGARGLTQLMPATAAETARKLRLKTYDLDSPEDNVAMGARYLADMIRGQGRIYLALMAYNAGGGRIKPWKTSMGKLPEEIFVEAAPFQETRDYVRKILTSTVLTGVLHYNKTLDSMVKLIYPGFRP